MSQFQPESIKALIDEYGLDLEGNQADKIVATWLQEYETAWIIKAIVETVFRRIYKVRTVDGILKQWQRQGKPLCNFKPEFERERLKKFLATPEPAEAPPSAKFTQPVKPSTTKRLDLHQPNSTTSTPNQQQLNPEELEPFHHHHRLVPLAPSYNQDNSSEQSPTADPHDLPDALIDTPNLICTNSVKTTPQPPRLKLLDTLKRAIHGAATPELDESVSSEAGDKSKRKPIGEQPKPAERIQIPRFKISFQTPPDEQNSESSL
jgi:hypothetical protein